MVGHEIPAGRAPPRGSTRPLDAAAFRALRVVVVLVALLAVGSDDPNGRADGSFLLLTVLGTIVALAAVVVAVSVSRALRPGRPAAR